MEDTNYKAKKHYQNKEVVEKYDEARFTTWHGKIAHQIESNALEYAINKYFEQGGSILDIPCGTGRLLHLYEKGKFRVVGADVSEEMLKLSKERFKNNPLYAFQKCDAEALPFEDNSFDYLVSYRLMCHLPPKVRKKVLAEMIRITKDVLVINYHFNVNSPLMIFNRIFRKQYLPQPLKQKELEEEIKLFDVKICEIKKLSWFERSSSLVILKKIIPTHAEAKGTK